MRRRQFTSHFKILFRSRFRIIFTFFKLTDQWRSSHEVCPFLPACATGAGSTRVMPAGRPTQPTITVRPGGRVPQPSQTPGAVRLLNLVLQRLGPERSGTDDAQENQR